MSQSKLVFCLILAVTLFYGWPVVAAERSLIPDTPNTAPDYFCTWNLQGYVSNYANADAQADAMVEANLFGNGPKQDWLSFFPDARGDLIFLLDDAFDFPIGGGHHHPARGSVELDDARFPSYRGPQADRWKKLNADVTARGWRGLGLWICNSRNRLPGQEQIDNDTYWSERLAWSQSAGVQYWKVDWGIGDGKKPLWKFRVTPKTRAAGPDVWIEFNTQGDIYRTYDVGLQVSIPETIRRIAAFLEKQDPNDHRMICCEDEVYIGAALGCHYGVMRHPLAGNMPNGKSDGSFPESFRDVKRRMDEVTRAVRWHRIAQPLYKGDAFQIDPKSLTDFKSRPAPARIARGGLPLPTVAVPGGGEPPYVLCARNTGGEVAICTVPRNLGSRGRSEITFPLADVTLDIQSFDRPVGVFGKYASLTLKSANDLTGKRILAQDLAGKEPVEITREVRVDGGTITIPGAVINRLGLIAAKPGDVSDPGLVIAVAGITRLGGPTSPLKPATFGKAASNDTPKIPTDGLALWLRAGSAEVESGEVVRLRDHSGGGNDAIRQRDPKTAAGNPTVVRDETSGQPLLRFDGRFTGYELNSIKDARTVVLVVSKHSAAFKTFNERFVLGGKLKTSVDYHVGCHWTDTIIELGMFKHGKAWFNGFAIDPALSEFSQKLAVISFIAGRDTIIDQIARDRDFVDRSWYGDIAEILVYKAALSDADRQAVEMSLMKKYAITPFQPVVVTRESVLPGHTKPPAGPPK